MVVVVAGGHGVSDEESIAAAPGDSCDSIASISAVSDSARNAIDVFDMGGSAVLKCRNRAILLVGKGSRAARRDLIGGRFISLSAGLLWFGYGFSLCGRLY